MRNLLSKEVVEYNIVELLEDYNTRLYFLGRGASSVVMTLLRDRNDRPVGIVMLEFIKTSFSDSEINEKSIIQASKSIFNLLVYGRT